MDNKTIFIRTSKGEDEMHSRTTHLPGDIKRALLMVDGNATFGEISKRAAPSLRSILGEMFQELEKGGFIQEKTSDKALDKVRSEFIPKMSVPLKMATPHKTQPVVNSSELDFLAGFGTHSSESPAVDNAKKLRAEAEDKSIREIEAVKFSAQLEAEAILHQAEQEAARIREETVRRAKAEAEATRLKAEQEARKVRDELAAAKLKAEQEARLRLEEAARVRQQAEAARIKAEQEAERMRIELGAAKMRAEQETRIRLDATAKAQARIQAEDELAKTREVAERIARQEQEAAKAREEAERIARHEQRVREETERIIRQEQEAAKAREEAERIARHEQRVREETERIIRQEQETARAREAAAREQSARIPETPAEKPSTFSFDSFQVDQPLYTSESHIEKKPAKKASPVQQPAPPPVASKPIDSKPTQKQIQRAMQERIAVEKRMATEALEAKKMAETQARIWAEAEQRALGAAKAEVEQIARQVTYTVADAPAAKSTPVARVRRKSFSWGRLAGFFFKIGLLLLVLLVGALFVIPYVLPMRDYMPMAEQMLSGKLHQPVHVGRLSGRFLPAPRIELGEIYIGDAKQFQADVAQINFSFMGLLTDATPINSIEFQGVKVRGAWVRNTSEWLQKMASDPQYPVSRMAIANGMLDADAFQLKGIEGNLDFDPDGKFTRANLHANAGKYVLGVNATPENNLNIALTVRDSALPLMPNWTFDVLTAKGTLSNGDLQINNFDARMLGGVVQGNAAINWRSGWNAQGEFSAKSVNMQMLDKLLDGTIEGSARFRMSSADLGGLVNSVALDGNFSSKEGMIGGMEIADTARKRSKENLPGGRTHYDELTGVVSFDNGIYHFKQTKITASALSAIATFDVDASNQLSGKMNVSQSIHDKTLPPVELQMGGTIDSPTLVYSP